MYIFNMFGRSPYASLRSHVECVFKCVHALSDLFAALERTDFPAIEAQTDKLSEIEKEADIIKNHIRSHLPKGLFLSIDRQSYLDILSIQDKIADTAQDIAILMSLKPLHLLPIFQDEFRLFVHKNIAAFDQAYLIVKELHELIESSFGGIEAAKVSSMVDAVAEIEHEVDLIQRKLLRKLFQSESELSYGSFMLWHRLFEAISSLSNLSENLANRIRMTLELN